jgi:hypothetical protein
MGMGPDKISELFRLEAASAVAHPVGATGFQHFGGPRGPDEVVLQKNGVPEVEIHGKSVHLDVQEKRGGKEPAEFQGLETLSLPEAGRRNLPPFARMRDGGTAGGEVDDGAEVDPGADVLKNPGGKVGILFRVVDQQGYLR